MYEARAAPTDAEIAGSASSEAGGRGARSAAPLMANRRGGATSGSDEAYGKDDAPLSDAEIARSASRGAVASLTRNGTGLVLQAISSLVVARLLDPRSYGVFGLSLTVVSALAFLGDLGVTNRLEVLRRTDVEEVSRSLGIGLVVAGVGGLVVSIIWQFLPLVETGPPGSRFVAPVLAFALLVSVPRRPAIALLSRRLKFRTVADSSLLFGIVFFVLQIPLLIAGWGIWAMVTAYAVSSLVNGAYLIVAARGLPRPSLRGPIFRLIRLSLPYQAPFVAQAGVGLIVSLVVASMLGASGVGFFAWSTTLGAPIIVMIFTLERVISPSLARMLRDDGQQYSQATSVVVLTFATLSATAAATFIGLVPCVVRFIFNSRWLPATGAVQMSLIGVVPTALVMGCAAVVNSQDRPGDRLKASIAAAGAALVLTVPLTLAAGVTGAAAVAYVISPIVEVIVLASQAGARLVHLGLRIARIAVPLGCLSVLLGHLATSRATFAAALVLASLAAAVALGTMERQLVRSLWRQVRPQAATAR
jgi:O-antigen/teichoic acid export membrane protein